VKFLYITAGYISIFLLSLCGISAYLCINTLINDRTTSLVGASCYQLSTLAILNMSQNDNTLSVLIAIPIIIMVIHKCNIKNAYFSFIALTLILFAMINFMFLQTVSYAFILLGSYALYRSIKEKNKILPLVCLAALFIAMLANFPRIYTLFCEFQQYARQLPPRSGINLNDFEEIYKAHTRFIEMLRWFDNVIFGHVPSESLKANRLNISEGFLLYTSSFIPFLIIYTSVYYKGKFFHLPRSVKCDAGFFFWTFILTLSFVFIKPLLYTLYFIYFKVSFFHSRALLIALLSTAILTTYALRDLRERHIKNLAIKKPITNNIFAFFLAVILILSIELISKQYRIFFTINGVNILEESLLRTGLSGTLFILLIFLISSKIVKNTAVKYTSFSCLCFAIVMQACLIDYVQINSKNNFSPGINFGSGDFYYADRNKFLLPNEQTVQSLRASFENDEYRTLLVCDPKTVDYLCVGHVPGFWQLRVADGYYGMGLPKRLLMLPWESSIRAITFLQFEGLPWALFSLLSVKYALKVTPELYENMPSKTDNGQLVFKDTQYKINPYPVLPRAFFSESIKPVPDSQAARDYIFQKDRFQDVRKVSAVEGNLLPKTYSTQGQISVTGRGDRLEIDITPSNTERFLVLNDLYFPGWSARANGQELLIYPTNIYARGIILPPLVDKVIFQYETLATSPKAWYFYLASILLLVMGAVFLKIFGASIK
jgi:hypothetical protein